MLTAEEQSLVLSSRRSAPRPMNTRQLERQILTAGAFRKIPLSTPRSLRRQYARLAMKIARRTKNKTWEYPLTVKDYHLNLMLTNQALQLAAKMDVFA